MRFNAFGKRHECKLPSYELKETGKEESAASLPMLPNARPTQRTGEATTIVFVNRRKEPLDIFWIDPDGERHSYGAVAAGQESVMQSYAGHVWLITDKKKRTLAVFEAVEGGGRAILGPNLKVKTKQPDSDRPTGINSPDGKWTATHQGQQPLPEGTRLGQGISPIQGRNRWRRLRRRSLLVPRQFAAWRPCARPRGRGARFT